MFAKKGARVVYVQSVVRGRTTGLSGIVLSGVVVRRRREAPRVLVRFDADAPFPGASGKEHWMDDATLDVEVLLA